MEKFEYKTLSTDAKGMNGGKVNIDKFQDELNALGADGWELINSIPSDQLFGNTRYVISVFKRKIM